MRSRLEKVAQEVIGKQLTALSDSGMVEFGETMVQKPDPFDAALLTVGSHIVPDPKAQPDDLPKPSRLCLSMDSSDKLQGTSARVRHYRQSELEATRYDPLTREVEVRLYASRTLSADECQQGDLDLVANREIDTNFWVGLFDFPLIDNTHLSHGERCAVSVTELSVPGSLKVALAYFPGSRASLKDKPYYDEVVHDLLNPPEKGDH